jgi:hypothetical protein
MLLSNSPFEISHKFDRLSEHLVTRDSSRQGCGSSEIPV